MTYTWFCKINRGCHKSGKRKVTASLFRNLVPQNNPSSRQIELTPEEISLSKERYSPGAFYSDFLDGFIFGFQRQTSFAGEEDVGQSTN